MPSLLNKALGTVSSDFVNASLLQIQAAARSPFGTISETAMNAALAMIAGAKPKDEIEGALTVQMACTHTAAMAILGKLDGGFGACSIVLGQMLREAARSGERGSAGNHQAMGAKALARSVNASSAGRP